MAILTRDFGNLTKAGTPTNGVNEVQTLTITGSPTGGTFTMTYAAQTTSALAYNATAAQVQAALIALSTIGASDVVCTGGPLPGTGVVCTFGGDLAGLAIALMTTTDSLTGGATPATVVTETTAGVQGSYRGCAPGQIVVDTTNHKIYQNTGTRAVPVWTEAGVS